eukprot:TRINITY_DN26306_c0_g1_i2.p1 TRINITY_DN26306_c0_g1~~TRINITY_DN26306_c0_g1_i2.p1  ORF type:complete len:621 (+),score=255.04 TRINITY_DN26306_c0_g1_i2:78-1865(+)
MPFVVLCAADFGAKVNFELEFPQRPSIAELRARIESDLGAECSARRPGRPFVIHRAQVFDERLEMWVDLMSPSQLDHGCQVYIFQRESPYQRDDPGPIPAPTRSRGSGGPPSAASAAPQRGFGGAGDAYPPPSSYPPVYADPAYGGMRGPGYARGVPPPGAPYGVGSAYPSQMAPSAAEGASGHAEKTRTVFEELDCARRRAFALSDWMDLLQRLGIRGDPDTGAAPFSDDTSEDLFRKADTDSDGQVSWQEWQQFTEVYPKLLDSIYFRAREWNGNEARRADLDRARGHVTDLERALEDAKEAALEAEADIEGARQKVDDAGDDVTAAQQAEQAAEKEKERVLPDKETAQQALKEAKQAQAQVKEEGRKREAEKRNAQRGVDAAQKRLRQREDERDRAQKELERLQRLVKAQEEEVAKKDKEVERAKAEVDKAGEAAREAADPAQERAADKVADDVRQAEEKLRELADKEAEHDREAKEAQRGAQAARRAREAADRDLKAAEDRARQRRDAEGRVDDQLRAAREALERMERQQQEDDARRAEQERTEAELLQLEVRLREQRLAVEQKEAQLRTAHRSFNEDAGRRSPRRGGPPL